MVAFGLFLSHCALAHDPFQGTAIARVSNDALELTVTLARATVESNLLNSTASAVPETEALRSFINAAGQLFELTTNRVALSAIKTNATLVPKDNDVEFQLIYPRPNSGPLQIRAAYLSRLPGIDGYGVRLVALDVDNQVVLDQKWLVRGDPVLEVNLLPLSRRITETATPDAVPRRALTFQSFLKLGIEHILTGYDHLLFLLGLLVVCRRVSSIVTVITCFTLAHSLTLALTALNVVNVSSRVIEPLIAATIMFVGVENLARHGEPKGRWLLTLAFGLIHGFGLAGAFKDVGLGANGGSVLMPLFSFNLGVEIGQLAVAAIFLPVLWKLRTIPAFNRYGVAVISVLVATAGFFWLVQRVFF